MTRQAMAGASDVRRHNLAVLVNLLHVRGPMRRAELTDLTGLNRSTVAGLVAELAALGAVVEELGHAPVGAKAPRRRDPGPARDVEGRIGKAGRPSPVVRPCPERVQVLAADVGVGGVSMALIGLGGSIVARCGRSVSDSSPAVIAGVVAELGAELLGTPAVGEHVVGLGISVPGVVRSDDGNVRFAPNLGWQDAPLGELVAAALAERGLWAVPVRVGNDGDLGVLAEHQRGVARGVDDVVFVEGEVGVGCGVIVGGRPLVGAGGYAGELGHMSVRRDGRQCRCGAEGCWETEIGQEAIARALGMPERSEHADVVARLRTGDPEAAARLDDVARFLGLGLAIVVNLLNPRLVVLGGLLRDLYPLVADRVAQTLADTALRAPMEQVTLAVPELGGDAVLLGAGEFVWQDFLADPVEALADPRADRSG